jgi:hypothetical protein
MERLASVTTSAKINTSRGAIVDETAAVFAPALSLSRPDPLINSGVPPHWAQLTRSSHTVLVVSSQPT